MTIMPAKLATASLTIDCLVCPVQSCLVHRGNDAQARAWSEMLAPRQALMPGDGALFRAGDGQRALYSVRGGCLKTFTVDAEGNERIRGFHFPGDLIGLDAIGDGRHLSTAVAVVPSQVCVAPMVDLQSLMSNVPAISIRVMRQMSQELAMSLAISGNYPAEQRLAAFLLFLRERTGAVHVVRFPMAQRDVGNYLRLANETVCRYLKRFEKRGWISMGNHSVRLLDEVALREMADAIGITPHAATTETSAPAFRRLERQNLAAVA
ncbi:helix-turn-helix domain-containing protein [Nevskia sp.]|uniref:helix-turn-helix domain-containing protein n=1 Tax=Nevskia sp. TaxID=1929292 RepID=UPI0025D1D17A|nr:helix-turn-helix domain-containing protein [Nevskia sp.]